MEKIIYLDTDEEITSILDKIEKTKEEGIILVVPKGATLLQSLVNLKLLSKRAIELKKEIALVTSDRIGRNLASVVGFSVYSDLKEKSKIKPKEPYLPTTPPVVVKSYVPLQEKEEESPASSAETTKEKSPLTPPSKKEVIYAEHRPAPKLPQVNLPKVKMPKMPEIKWPEVSWGLWLGLASGFALIFLTLYFILPKATLTIKVKVDEFAQNTEMTIDSTAIDVDVAQKSVPGFVFETEKEGAKKFPASGKKNIGEKATGLITISNLSKNPDGSGAPLSLKANIEVKEKKTGKIFLTNSSVNVPALAYNCDVKIGVCEPVAGTATVKITASEPGSSYNLGPSEFVFPGLGNAPVSAKSEAGTNGGSDKYATAVSEEDINKAKAAMEQEVAEVAKKELKKQIKPNQVIIDEAIKYEVVSASSSVPAGEIVPEFEYKIKVKAMTLAVYKDDYRKVLDQFVASVLPFDKRLIGSAADSVKFSLISYDTQKQQMKLKAEIKAKVAAKIDEARVKKEVAKKTKEEATEIVKKINEVQDVSISLFPYWSKRLPEQEKINLKFLP